MTKQSMSHKALPTGCEQALREMGERIAMARKRRSMTQAALAARMFVTPKTVQRLEQGEAGVSLGVLISALLSLNLENDICKVAALETDALGIAQERSRLHRQQRVRKPRVSSDSEF